MLDLDLVIQNVQNLITQESWAEIVTQIKLVSQIISIR